MLSTINKQEVQKESKLLAMPCEVYSRIVGYYRPVKDWHESKQGEFEDRNYLTTGEGE
jgi:anaerobic ribonucleoside-triphosphate reductase